MTLRFKKTVLSMVVLICASMAPVLASSDQPDLEAVRFPISLWDDKLLKIVDDGPKVLSRDEELVVQPYPGNSSDVTKEELKFLLEIAQKERTEENIERILLENSGMRVYEIFEHENLIPEGNYKTIDLLELIDNDFMYFTLYFKKHFSRPRPSQLAELVFGHELPLVIKNPGHASYPSGHAGQTYIVALVLADIDPDNAEVYKQFSVDVAHRREIAGVHYPSDSEAGRQLARDVYEVLKKIPAFKKKLDDVTPSYIKPTADTIAAVMAYKRDYN